MDTTTQTIADGNTGDEAQIETRNTTRTLSRSRRSLAELERNVQHYPEAIRTPVLWMQGFWRDECSGNDSALRVLGEKLGFAKSDEYFYNLLGGYYFKTATGMWKEGGKAWGEFLEFVEALKRYSLQAARAGKQQFIATPTYACTADFIGARRALNAVCKIGGITGATGAQKTACLRQYAVLNNHGQVVLIQAPATARVGILQRKIADRYHIRGAQLTYLATREAAIRENLNETRTLIIDNAQRLYIDGKGSDQPCFNWLLELQEDTECTLILSFTTDFTDVLTAGRAKGYFEQLVGRMGGMDSLLRLPDYAPAADLRCIARAFGLEAGKSAMEYLHRWSRQAGRIRIVFHRLQLAQNFAKAEGRNRITLADLEAASEYIPAAIGTDSDDEGGAA